MNAFSVFTTGILVSTLFSPLLSEGGRQLTEDWKKKGLVDAIEYIPDLVLDIRYSGVNNFLKEDLYGDFNVCYLQKEVAILFRKADRFLKQTHPHLSFLCFDGARPLRVQKRMWDRVKGTDKEPYVANPDSGSIHNYGAAIDLSLFDRKKNQSLDMGTDFDYFGRLAEPNLESELLKEKLLTEIQYKNRQILRKAMESAGFAVRYNEWWHFDAYPEKEVKKKFPILN
ncbi:MAG: M15 family metallopeptidase [Leptospiraceae bacterium]|nr:M15 family metallopeptidase [Leptospiraceae bacterium]MCP5511332.1 M15 family metallopeptidase [Leptospiraceae bacterium]